MAVAKAGVLLVPVGAIVDGFIGGVVGHAAIGAAGYYASSQLKSGYE